MLLGRRAARNFLDGAWPDQHFVVHRPPRQLPPIFREGPLATFDGLAQVYGGRVQVAGGRGDDHLQFTIENAPAQHLRRIGVTVFFGDDVSAYVAGAPEFLRSLETALGAPLGIGAIRTFASAPGGGLESHYDHGETFIVQLEGTKELRLARNPSYPLLQFIAGKPPVDEHYAEYTDGFPTRAPPDEVVVTLEPGSVLFIPRGMWHRTEASDSGPSYSASICIDTPAPAELLLSALRLYLRQSPDWRRPAYGAWGSQRAPEAERLRELLRELSERLPSLSAEGILDGGAPFDLCAPTVEDGRRFQRVPTTRLELGKGLRLRAIGHGGREVEIQLNRALLPVSNWLKRREGAFRFADLQHAHPKLERSLLTTLVQSLVAAEALRWLPFDAYDAKPEVLIRGVGR
jgi:hypothetical protein